MRKSQRGISISIEGSEEAKRAFTRLGNNQNKASREYVKKASTQVKKAVREELSHNIRIKALYDSIDVKIPLLKSTKVYMAIVGPRKDFKRFIRSRPKNRKGDLYAIPKNYAHLLESGSWKTGARYTKKGRYTGTMPAFHRFRDAAGKVKNITLLLASSIFRKHANAN